MKAIKAKLNNLQPGKKLFSVYIPAFIVAAYLVIALLSVRYDDITFDEPNHMAYGVQIIKGKPDRNYNNPGFRSTMPVSALNALPRAFEQIIKPGTKKNDWGKSDNENGRYITIILTLILLFYCFKFSAMLSSESIACVILAFVAFDPNIIAHSRLVTTDIYATTGFIAAIYHLYKWQIEKQTSHFYYWSIAIAIAQCCKANNILLYPVSLVIIIFYFFKHREHVQFYRLIIQMLIFIFLQILIINAFFLFSGPWGCSLSQLPLQSNFFKSLQSGWISRIPIPFSKAYIDTFDRTEYERETFDGTALNYLVGALRYKRGFWDYYVVCYFLKTPVVTIVISLAGVIYSLGKRTINVVTIFFCCWPCLFIFIFISSSSIQNGYRYLLPLACLLLIFSSSLLEKVINKMTIAKLLFLSAIPFLAAVIAFPNYISYTNAFIYQKKIAYHYFADSNLNWGQRKSALQKFLKDHPEYIFEPDVPSEGMIVVDLNNLAGIQNTEKFKWLRDNYAPLATIDDCYLIYDVKQLPLNSN